MEAEKFQKPRWPQYCGTTCKTMYTTDKMICQPALYMEDQKKRILKDFIILEKCVFVCSPFMYDIL